MSNPTTLLHHIGIYVLCGFLGILCIIAMAVLLYMAGYSFYLFGGIIGVWKLSPSDRKIASLDVYE